MEAKSHNWNDSIIRDGFTQPYYIAADDRRHGAVRFTARPMLFSEIEDAEQTIENPHNDPKKRAGRMIRAVVEHVQSWNLSEPVSASSVACLRRPVLIKMYNMISSQWPSDIDPQWQDLQTGDEAVDPDVAMLDGLTQPGITRFQDHLGKS